VKVKQSIKYLFYSLLALVLAVLMTAFLVFNSVSFQNWLTQKVTSYLSAQFKTKITIDRIKYHPFAGFELNNVYWGDHKNDTLFFVDDLRFNFGGFNRNKFKLTLNDVILNGAYCKMITYPDSTFNIDVLYNIFDPNDTIPDTLSPPLSLYLNRVACHNTRFRFIDSTEAFEPTGFDGFNQDFNKIELLAKDFWIVDDSLHFDLKKLATVERSGFTIDQISGMATICKSGMLFDSLDVKTPYSHITKRFHMLYNGWEELGNFNEVVKLEGDIENTKVDMRDITYFAPFLAGSTQLFTVNGHGSGTISNLKLTELKVDFGKSSKFYGSGSINGLPNVDETFVDIKATEAQTNKVDLERLITIDLPSQVEQLGIMKFKGRYTGFFNDFVAYGDFNSAAGSGHSDLNMKLGDSTTLPSYSGSLVLNNFDLGKMFSLSVIGKTSLTATINGKGFNLADLESSVKTKVTYFEANHYRYQQIELGGKIKHKMFEGMFEMNDPNAEVKFDGTIDLNQEIPFYQFKASIAYANLKALKFDTSNLVLSSDIDINFAIKDLDQNNGTIKLNNILFIKDGVDYPINNVLLSSVNNGNQKVLTLKSDIIEGGLKGNFSFEQMPQTLTQIMHAVLPEYVAAGTTKNNSSEVFSYYLSMDDSRILSDLFFPSVQLTQVDISGKVNGLQNEFSLNASAQQILYNQYVIDNVNAKIALGSNKKGEVDLSVYSLATKDSVIFKDLTIHSEVHQNNAVTKIKIKDSTALVFGGLDFATQFNRSGIATNISSSWFSIRHKKYAVSNTGLITYNQDSSQLIVRDFIISDSNENAEINGFYNINRDFNIVLQLNDVNLSVMNIVLPQIGYTIGGNTNGKIVIKGDKQSTLVNSYVNVDELVLDNDTIGDFSITSNYDEKQQRIIGNVKSVGGKLKDLEMGGYIDISQSPYPINATIVFAESDLKSFQAFVKDDVTIFYGKASAKCKITGTTKNILVDGSISLNQVLARVEYLKTVYGFNAKVTFDKNTITLLPFQLKDINGKQAKVSGVITHQSFDKFKFDLSLADLNGFQLLNTTSKDNNLFYGKAYATGRMSLKGPQDDLVLDGVLKSAKGTVFCIPLSEGDAGDENGIINFTNKDTTIKSVVAQKQSAILGLGINLNITVTPDAEIQLVFDEAMDDKIVGTGKGTLQMDLNKQGVFNIYGEVAIENGDYKFTAVDVFTRKFVLKKGGTITWTGDPLQARMNIQGIYKVRSADVGKLLIASDSTRKLVPVECILNLKGNLTSPEIGFDLNFPDNNTLLGNNASALESSLRRLRNEPDLMQQQVVSLMLFGTFVPMQGVNQQLNPDISSEINNTLSSLISAQANNILAKVAPGFNVSTDYKLANANTGAQAQAYVSASKRFLNDKFEVRASVDVLNAGTNNITGQYDLRLDGNLKVIGFNRSAKSVLNTGYTQNVTTQGIGLYYRKEFDKFNELFKRKQKKMVIPNN
jgi:hypothetical protein